MHIIYFPVDNGGNIYFPNKMNQVTNRRIKIKLQKEQKIQRDFTN
jgi:hypothetical protein